jgi:hypothetical protein
MQASSNLPVLLKFCQQCDALLIKAHTRREEVQRAQERLDRLYSLCLDMDSKLQLQTTVLQQSTGPGKEQERLELLHSHCKQAMQELKQELQQQRHVVWGPQQKHQRSCPAQQLTTSPQDMLPWVGAAVAAAEALHLISTATTTHKKIDEGG